MLLFLLFCFSFLESNNSHFNNEVALSDTSQSISTDSIFLQIEQHLPFDFEIASDSFLISYADSLYFSGKYEASAKAFKYILSHTDDVLIKTYSYYSLGDLWDRKFEVIEGNRDSAIVYYKNTIELIEVNKIKGHYFIYDVYSLISEIYNDKRSLDSAEYFLRKINILEAEKYVEDYWVMEYYVFMTSIYYYRREYQQSLKWIGKGEVFFYKSGGDIPKWYISLLVYKGAIFHAMKDHVKAEKVFLRVLELSKNEISQTSKMSANRFLGHIWSQQKDYKKGLEFYLDYLTLYNQGDYNDVNDINQYNEVLSSIGYNYRELDQLDSSLLFYQDALIQVKLIQDNRKRNFKKVQHLYHLAELLYLIDSTDVNKPFFYLNQCDSILTEYTVDQFSERTDILFFYSKIIRADIHVDFEEYEQAADYYWQAYLHLKTFLSYISNTEDKLRNYQEHQDNYHKIINNLFKAYEETGDVTYINKGLEVVETMRSLLLYQKTFESGEETTISFLDTGWVASDEFLAHKKVQREFHEYQQKHTGTQRLESFHQYLKSSEKTFLSYFLSGQQLHIVLVDGQETIYKSVELTGADTESLNRLKNGLYETNRLVFKFSYLEELELLYRLFITPVEKHLKNDQLIVSKSGLLSYIPFDILISDISDLRYLIEDYSIQNIYSWHHMMLQQERKSTFRKQTILENQVLAFAPFAIKDLVPSYAVKKGERFLQYSLKEVNNVSNKAYLGKEASKQLFLDKYQDFPLIHLATHAASNTEDVLKSHIAFFPSDSNMVDHRLYFNEISEMNFSNQALVILSACETSYGENIPVEGIMSLERAFAYAQAPSLISSQWKADDESTAFIVSKFYGYLKVGLSKSKALQNAKIDFLVEYPRCRFQPLFWGGIILTGDDSSLTKDQYFSTQKILIYTLLLTFIGLSLFYTIRKKV